MGEEKEILLRRKVCAYLTCRLMGDPFSVIHYSTHDQLLSSHRMFNLISTIRGRADPRVCPPWFDELTRPRVCRRAGRATTGSGLDKCLRN